jgi:hypothetical protein
MRQGLSRFFSGPNSLLVAAALCTLVGLGDRAQAQAITKVASIPTRYSGAGEKIFFRIEFNSGNFVVQSVNVVSALGVRYSCTGWLAGLTNQHGFCTGAYVTKASDAPNPIQESPTVTLLALGNIPHQLNYQGGNVVITVAACDAGQAQACMSLVQGQIPWRFSNTQDPASRHWSATDLNNLCGCATDPPKTVLCFQNALYNNGHAQTQSQAIAACRAK